MYNAFTVTIGGPKNVLSRKIAVTTFKLKKNAKVFFYSGYLLQKAKSWQPPKAYQDLMEHFILY